MRTHAPTLALLSCFSFLSIATDSLGTPNHLWSQRFGSPSSSTRGMSVAANFAGEVFLAGTFTGPVSFGGTEIVGRVFLAKYDASGGHLWSKPIGITTNITVFAAATDTDGNVVLTGGFGGTQNLGGSDLVAVGSSDIYVVKFDASGSHLWSRSFGTALGDVGYAIATNDGGNVLVTGYLRRSGACCANIFIAKYDGAGTLLWSKDLGAEEHDEGLSIATDALGNVLVTGSFFGTVNLGGAENLVSAGVWDIFLAKYDADGTHLWSKQFGGAGGDASLSLKTDSGGNIVVTGYFSGTVSFGGDEFTSHGEDVDAFVAKFDANGGHLWSRGFGDTSYEYGYHLAVDEWNNVHVIGIFTQIINTGGEALTSAGGDDIFVARYDRDGAHLWSQGFGDTGTDEGVSIDADAMGNVFIAGHFDGTVDFGGGALASAGTRDAYLAKFGSVATSIDRAPARGASPNPFNPSTTIRYELPTSGRVTISIHDVRGARVATLVDEDKPAGRYETQWRGKDRSGSMLASGLYFASIEHGGERQALKLVVLK